MEFEDADDQMMPPDLGEDEAEALTNAYIAAIKIQALEQGRAVVEKGPRRMEEELELQAEVREALANENVSTEGVTVKIIEFEEVANIQDEEARFIADRKLMEDSYAKGDIQLMEESCASLLARKPDDYGVWRTLVLSRLRLRLYDSALEAARRWIEFEPHAVSPRNAECLALAGLGQYGEARARLALLAEEVDRLDPDAAQELRECVWRIDELWMEQDPGVCKLSANPATFITGVRAPHFFLPNLANSIGPVRIVGAEPEELGGGHSHLRKMVVTRDVEPGDLLFVQNSLVIGAIERDEHMDRLGDALFTCASTSPRAARLVDLLLDSERPQPQGEDVVAILENPGDVRDGGCWSRDPGTMKKKIDACTRIVDRNRILTGRDLVGIWTLPAMARHSCVPTANYTCFGDVMIARASRSLRCGDEVTFHLFDVLSVHEIRQATATDNLGNFWCKCPRCQAEGDIDRAVEGASMRIRMRFDSVSDRTGAIRMQLTNETEKRTLAIQKRFANMSRAEEMEYREGLIGLGDKFRNVNGRQLTDDDISEVREYLPDVQEPNMVEVPRDLLDGLVRVIEVFEDDITKADLDEELRKWVVASHMPYYNEVLLLLRLQEDLVAQKRLLGRLLPAVAAVEPGSFIHIRLSVLNWELAAQLESATETKPEHASEVAAKEKEAAIESLRIRYGTDLTAIEAEAAIARAMVTRIDNENWFWEVSWCIGGFQQEEKDVQDQSSPGFAEA